jgi:hypothetical protein
MRTLRQCRGEKKMSTHLFSSSLYALDQCWIRAEEVIAVSQPDQTQSLSPHHLPTCFTLMSLRPCILTRLPVHRWLCGHGGCSSRAGHCTSFPPNHPGFLCPSQHPAATQEKYSRYISRHLLTLLNQTETNNAHRFRSWMMV